MKGICKQCGCTETTPCIHPDFGACWWLDNTQELCSHCVELKDDPEVKRQFDIKLLPAGSSFPSSEKLLALSWKQPYAELMLHGKIETRIWKTNYRGWVLICVSKQPYTTEKLKRISGGKQLKKMGEYLAKENPGYEGKAIAIGKLIDCRPMQKQDEDKCFVEYYPDLFCHIYEDVRAIKPFDWKGSQGWKEVDIKIKENIVFL